MDFVKHSALALSLITLVNCGGGGGDTPSDPNDPFTDPQTPSAMILDDSSTTALALSWDMDSSADNYKLYRDGNLIATLNWSEYEYLDRGLTASSNYTYQYSILSGGSESSLSPVLNTSTQAEATTLPADPTNARVISRTATSVTIGWTDNATDEIAYNVRRPTPVNTILFVPFDNSYTVEDTGLTSDTSYNYEISALNDAGVSSKLITTVTTLHPATTPAAPSGVSVSSQTSTSLTTSFTDNASNEDGYLVSVVGTSNFDTFCEGTDLSSCQITGLNPGTSYDLEVSAFTYTEVGQLINFYISSTEVIVSGTTSM